MSLLHWTERIHLLWEWLKLWSETNIRSSSSTLPHRPMDISHSWTWFLQNMLPWMKLPPEEPQPVRLIQYQCLAMCGQLSELSLLCLSLCANTRPQYDIQIRLRGDMSNTEKTSHDCWSWLILKVTVLSARSWTFPVAGFFCDAN